MSRGKMERKNKVGRGLFYMYMYTKMNLAINFIRIHHETKFLNKSD